MVNVVFHTAFIGDLILTVPLLQRLKEKHPNRPLVLVCRPAFKEFFLANRIVDEVIVLDKKSKNSIQNFNQQISKYEIDLLICVHQSFHSAWLLRHVRANHKISYTQFWNFLFFSQRVERPMHLPEALRALSLIKNFDDDLKSDLQKFETENVVKNSQVDDTILFSHQSLPKRYAFNTKIYREAVRSKYQQISPLREPYVVVAPGSQWQTKRWTTQGFSEVTLMLLNSSMNVYFVGSAAEEPVCNEIMLFLAKQKVTAKTEFLSFAGQTSLIELQSIIAGAQLVVSNDSGSMHMATFVGVPVVAIFGPTVLELGYRPWGNQAVVVQKRLVCRPCGKHGSQECPIRTHECMTQITSQHVFAKVEELLLKNN